MEKATSLLAVLDRFDFDAQCTIESFSFVWVPKQEDPVEVINHGSQFNERLLGILQKVKAGDLLYFDEVRCKCPGDLSTREINPLIFKLK